MDIQKLDLNGGTFKVNLPYNWVGWLLWAIGLIIALIGFVVAVNDTNGLVVAAFGLLMMAFTSPGSLESNLHDVRQSAIDPSELEAKAEASGLSIDNWWMSQTSYVPTTDPSDWILPAPGPMSWNNDDRYGPHGDGSALPEHPSKVGTPIPATMTLFTVYCILAIACILIAAAALMTGGESTNECYLRHAGRFMVPYGPCSGCSCNYSVRFSNDSPFQVCNVSTSLDQITLCGYFFTRSCCRNKGDIKLSCCTPFVFWKH